MVEHMFYHDDLFGHDMKKINKMSVRPAKTQIR